MDKILKSVSIVLFACFYIGCSEEQKEEKSTKQFSVDSTTLSVDSSRNDEHFFTGNTKDTIVIIDNEPYHLIISAVIDSTKKMTLQEREQTYKGFNVNYKISLKGRESFTKAFTKELFRPVGAYSIIVESDAHLPEFMGYSPEFKAFAFTINFWVPDSDVGEQSFFLLSRKGVITEKYLNNSYGGGECDGTVEMSSDQKTIFTPYKIYNSDGKNVIIHDTAAYQVGTRMINGQCLLVIKQFVDTTNKKPNASLIDNYGKVLKGFDYKGYYQELGSTVPSFFDKATKNLYLLEEDKSYLQVINQENPLKTFRLDFAKMTINNGNKKGNEAVYEVMTDNSKFTFFIDAVTKKIRYRKGKNEE